MVQLSAMSDEIGYTPTEKDILAVVRWLKINKPENATPEYAKQMLVELKLAYREMGSIDEDMLHKELEKLKEN